MSKSDNNNQVEQLASRKKYRVEYLTPDALTLKAYVRDVCAGLGIRDSAYTGIEVQSGFDTFFRFTAEWTAKHLTEGSCRTSHSGNAKYSNFRKGGANAEQKTYR